jgi:hypothetical protein
MPFNIGGQIVDANTLGIFNQVVNTNLMCYLDATIPASYSGSGTTWNDISGNSRNFTWVSNPTFSNSNSFLTLGNRCIGPASNSVGITNTSGYTIFIIMKQVSITSAGAFKFYTTAGYTNSSTSRGIFSHCTWNNEVIYFDQGGCCGSDTRLFSQPVTNTTTQWGLYGFRRLTNSSTRNIFINGISVAVNTDAAADINLGNTPIDLASSDEYGGNSSSWNAQLSAFLIYNRGLSDTEMLQNYYALKRIHNI